MRALACGYQSFLNSEHRYRQDRTPAQSQLCGMGHLNRQVPKGGISSRAEPKCGMPGVAEGGSPLTRKSN